MNVKINDVYKHFKGDYYIILDICYNADTLEKWVVYQGLYDHAKRWIRPMSDFTSKVDKQKYPNCKQEYRFELQHIKSKRDDH